MAEAIARCDASDVMEPSSAGLAPLGYVARMTTQTLANNGYSADGLESKPILLEMLEAAELVFNMSGRPREQVFPGISKVEDWEVEDPYGADPEIYQRICEEIRQRVAGLAARLRARRKSGRR
jgi:protein-tyrosine-phosphatase